MNTIAKLNELERRVLAILNEAGNECACTLLNAVFRCCGDDSEIIKFVTALGRLFELGLIEFSDRRHEATLELVVLAHGRETAEKLSLLSTQLTWEDDSGFWKWNTEVSQLEVLLTQNGDKLSHEILEKFGWEMTEPM